MADIDLRFSSPPVRTVELTFFFDAVLLRLSTLAPLVSALQEEFPIVEERFARGPWTLEENADQVPGFIEEGAEKFPFPWFSFSDGSGHSISFQDDRLMVRWQFNGDHVYPGYEALRGTLLKHFEDFVAHAEGSDTSAVHVRRVRVEYENAMGPYAAWSVAKQTFGAAELSEAKPLSGLQGTNAGGLFHFSDNDNDNDNDTVTHVDFVAVSEDADSTLSLRATADVASDVSDPGDALNTAHGHLIECFSALTTETQWEEWGRL